MNTKIPFFVRLKQLWRLFRYGTKYKVQADVEYDKDSAVNSLGVQSHWAKEEEEFNRQNGIYGDTYGDLTLQENDRRHWIITPKRRERMSKEQRANLKNKQ